jgi:hypothetical protein
MNHIYLVNGLFIEKGQMALCGYVAPKRKVITETPKTVCGKCSTVVMNERNILKQKLKYHNL